MAKLRPASIADIDNLVRGGNANPAAQLRATRTFITSFQGSHGYSKQTAAGTQSNDTTDFVTGTQSLKIVTDGLGSATSTRKSSISPTIDFSNKFPEIYVKVDDTSKCQELWVYASSDNFATSWYTWKLTDDISQIKSLLWSPVTLSFGEATVTGTPNRAAINAIQLRVTDKATGAVTVNFGGINLVPEPIEGIVTIQFDDNWDSVYSKAMPILSAASLPAVIFTIAARVGTAGYMTEENLRECQDVLKWDIANHSYNHVNFTTLSAEAAENDMINSREWLRQRGFKAYDHWAWPNGAYDITTTLPLIKKYARSARTIASYAETLAPGDNYRIRVFLVLDTTTTTQIANAVTQAKANKEWLILVYHKIVDTLTGGVSTEHLTASFQTEITDIVASGIRVATITDVLDHESYRKPALMSLENTLTPAGTTGAQTINKPAGTVNFAAGATSLVVTNSLVTSSSMILLSVQTNDATMFAATAVPASGSFTIRPNAAPTGETKVAFVIVN